MGNATVAYTDAQERVLRTFIGVGRCVGSRSTDSGAGYVHSATAKTLAAAGLLTLEEGATGRDVFTITADGRDALDALASADESQDVPDDNEGDEREP